MMKKNSNKLIFLIIFFAGFSFLIYEVSWNRYLSLILGSTVTASTIVLMSFMAGFGLGAFILGKHANKTNNLGKLLSVNLASIALMSFVNLLVIGKVIPILYRLFTNHLLADITFFALSFILLLIPAFFMGGIIPLVSKIVVSDQKKLATNIGTIYAFETLGSTIGGLFTGFVLLGTIGQKQTIIVAVVINLLLAAYVFISKKYNTSVQVITDKKTQKPQNNNSINSPKIALISTFIIGFAILGLQIVWIRIFRTYFTNTSYTFTLITTFVILGLSIGSLLYKRRALQIKNNDITILRSIIFIALFALFGLSILYKLPEILLFPLKNAIENPYVRLILVPIIASLLIVLPPAIVSGFAFPLACSMNSKGLADISKNVGQVLMTNTIGSVASPAIATFLLIPTLGVGKSILLFVLLLLGVAVYITFKIKSYKKIATYKNALIAVSVILLISVLFTKQIRFVPPSIKKFDKKILTYNETIEGTIIVVDEPKKGVFGKSTFINNSSVIGSNYDAIKAVKMVGHIPFFSNLKCENALIIGFGIGVTTSAIASHEEVKSIDCVELVTGLVKSAKHYNEFNFRVYLDKRLNIISGDGRHFLQTTSKKYDLISCDPTHPVLGSGSLYTQEYFQQCYNHLTDSGMVSQYLPLHKLRQEDLMGIIKTFHSVFPNSSVWLGQYHAILFGQKNAGKIDFETWTNKVNQMPKDDFMYLEPYHIAACLVFDSQKIEELTKNLKINKDNLSYTEFFSFKCFEANNIYDNLKYFSENRCAVDNMFNNVSQPQKMDNFVNGNIKLMESLYFSLKGEKKNALNSLRTACELNPKDQEYPFLIKLYYGKDK